MVLVAKQRYFEKYQGFHMDRPRSPNLDEVNYKQTRRVTADEKNMQEKQVALQ